uniref:SUMO specific peptidase 1 n=1 Tax=Paramormyrops kingsleyae TaxID=1676925 RepID=A0A3B3RJV1_9TELE|nr:sentrin-specific protease 1-like [Paramormyrops kingsleyae]
MFNKLYEWIGTGFANLRNGTASIDHPVPEARQDAQIKRKRPMSCVEDDDAAAQEDRGTKKSRIVDLMGTVKNAAEGVRTQSSSVASWMRSNVVNPSLNSILSPPARSSLTIPSADLSSFPAPSRSTCRGREHLDKTASSHEFFVVPSTDVGLKCSSKTESLRVETPLSSLKSCRRQVHADPQCSRIPKTNGHSVSPPACPCPRLGRSLNLGQRRSLSQLSALQDGARPSPASSAYEAPFPVRGMQCPSHSPPCRRRRRPLCTAQESVREEEKEVYRQLLSMVSGGHCPLFGDGGSCTPLRSHRDLTSFLTSSRRLLKCAYSAEQTQLGTVEHPSSPLSPQVESSLSSSNIPSPAEGSSGMETQAALSDVGSASPNPAALHDTSSQDTQLLAQDGDSVIFVKEQQGKEADGSSIPCFKAELWIRELTSLYDSRARERRRLIEEQEALTARLLKQRLSDESHVAPGGVELQVRVPLEKEVPLAPIVQEAKAGRVEAEFPELTEAMELEISRALRGGSLDEVLSEGFRLTITRKDLQTLSHLNWLNDEVINFYMNLLVERSRQPHLPSVYTFNTFFYPKLRSSGFSTVRRWTKKVDIFSSDILLVPIHLGVHWCLSVVDFRKKRITYFDSMGGSNDEACKILLKYLEQESHDKRGQQLGTSSWVLESKKRNEIPQQMNGSDCGMFTCKYAEYITKDRPITFTQKHMPYFRRRMVWEILNRKLL